jgi:hypothetical protein
VYTTFDNLLNFDELPPTQLEETPKGGREKEGEGEETGKEEGKGKESKNAETTEVTEEGEDKKAEGKAERDDKGEEGAGNDKGREGEDDEGRQDKEGSGGKGKGESRDEGIQQNKLAQEVGVENAHALLDHFYWSAFSSTFGNRVRDGLAHGYFFFRSDTIIIVAQQLKLEFYVISLFFRNSNSPSDISIPQPSPKSTRPTSFYSPSPSSSDMTRSTLPLPLPLSHPQSPLVFSLPHRLCLYLAATPLCVPNPKFRKFRIPFPPLAPSSTPPNI